jgi:hypothetical protein
MALGCNGPLLDREQTERLRVASKKLNWRFFLTDELGETLVKIVETLAELNEQISKHNNS